MSGIVLMLVVIVGCYVFPAFTGAVLVGGDWSHVAAIAVAMLVQTVITLFMDKVKP